MALILYQMKKNSGVIWMKARLIMAVVLILLGALLAAGPADLSPWWGVGALYIGLRLLMGYRHGGGSKPAVEWHEQTWRS